jgi:hypothetical protein
MLENPTSVVKCRRLTDSVGGADARGVVGKTAFERRIAELLEETGENETTLGTEAKLSHQTIRKWLAAAKHGNETPGTVAHAVKLVTRWGKTLDWLYSMGDPVNSTPALPGDLAMAKEAIGALVALDGIEPEKARSIVLDLSLPNPSAMAFYREARRRLAGVSARAKSSLLGEASELRDGPPPVRPGNTRKKRK